jgi:adenylate cyclase
MTLRNVLPGFLFAFAILAATIAIRAVDPPVLSAMRGAGFDTLQRFWPRQMETPQPVRVVDIDEASLKKLGQWPWPRKKLATLVDRLAELGAGAIVFDIAFPEPDRVSPRQLIADPDFKKIASAAGANADQQNWPDTDEVFAASMRGKPVVLGFATAGPTSPADVPVKAGFAQTGEPAINAPQLLFGSTHNLAVLDDAASGIGGFSLDLINSQGVARQIPMLWTDGQKFYPSLVVEAVRVAQGAGNIFVHAATDRTDAIVSISVGTFDIPVTEEGLFTLHYRADDRDLYVSAADMFDPANDEKLAPKIEGNIVFIGTSATGLLDTRTTALGQTIAGVSIHAQATEQILSGHFLKRPEWILNAEYLAISILGTLVAWLCAAFRPALPFATTGIIAMGILAASVFAFRHLGLLLDATFPLAALAITFLAGIAWRLLVTDKEGRKMRRVFGHYVAPSVLTEIESNPQLLSLGGQIRDVTVMFVDIVNFTPMTEALSAEELVQTVNGLWEVCGHAILERQGTIDKFIGDAVMAFWNAPVAVPGHQCEAARAALGIRAALEKFNQTETVQSLMKLRGLPPLALRIGMASGPAAVGNMGSIDRFDYSVLGDTVNIAARAETLCKRLQHDIAIAGDLAPETMTLAVLPAGHASLKGKSQSAAIHIVVGDEVLAASSGFATIKSEYEYVSRKISSSPSKRQLATLKQLSAELANRHPLLAGYFKALPERSSDFRSISTTHSLTQA